MHRTRWACTFFATLFIGVPAICWHSRLRAGEATGEQIYRERCASCHGDRGEGVAGGHPQPLTSDRSMAQLTKFIASTMPQDAPGTCTRADAEKVSAYIQDKIFNSPRVGLAMPRVELARLTVGQYRHAIADMLASLRGSRRWDDRRGLMGFYNAIDKNGNGKQVLDRLDPQIKFDFGTTSPVPDKIDPRVFSISWVGSLHAPVTGEYELIVRTENSARLYLNDRVQPLVDAWVRSGDEKEFRATIRLLAGRVYPLTLHYTKAGQGGRKPDDPKAPIPPGSIHLHWKLPGRLEEPIPQQRLSPVETAETLVVETSFPPDDRSTGFERGTSVTKEWDQATTDAAIEVADYVHGRLRDFAAVPELKAEHSPAIQEFCARFAERAFRRPLTPEQRALYVDRAFAGTGDVETAANRVILMVLKSPRFLYREIGGERDDGFNKDPFNAASRLSFALLNAPPDQELLAAAAGGQLATRDQLAAHSRRMTADPRFEAKLHEFLWHWMKLDPTRELTKDAGSFAEFDAAVAADLRTSLELYLDDIIHSEGADFRQLLVSKSLYLNGRLARIYGADLPADAPFTKVQVDPRDRAGVLSHPYVMATFADNVASSPIRRGVFVARGVLGRTLRPPPDAFVPLAPALHPDLTTRERVALQTGADACKACHGLINPLGFALERYDAIGRIRSEDNHRPIDATGSYLSRAGEEVRFDGARKLANFLAASEETHAAFVEKMFYYSVQQPLRAYGPQAPEELRRAFVEHKFNIRELMEEIAVLAALSAPGAAVAAETIEGK